MKPPRPTPRTTPGTVNEVLRPPRSLVATVRPVYGLGRGLNRPVRDLSPLRSASAAPAARASGIGRQQPQPRT
jgi:hypothetical protein